MVSSRRGDEVALWDTAARRMRREKVAVGVPPGCGRGVRAGAGRGACGGRARSKRRGRGSWGDPRRRWETTVGVRPRVLCERRGGGSGRERAIWLNLPEEQANLED